MSRQIIKRAGTASVVLFLVACSGLQKNEALIDAEKALEQAKQNEELLRYAPTELERARKALTSAASAKNAEDMTSGAYVAKTRVMTAEAVAARKAASARITELGKIKDTERLRARELEIQVEQDAKNVALREKETALLGREKALADAEAVRLEREQALADAEALRLELAELQAQKTERGMVMTLGDVLFSTGKTELLPGAMSTIEKLATFLAEYAEKTILIEGHTDDVGSDAFNQDLSERRALSVKSALVEAGVEDIRIDTVGMGESTPVAENSSSSGRLKNRRVEIVIKD